MTFKSDDNTQVDLSDEQNQTRRKITIDISVRYIPESEQTKGKSIVKYENVDPLTLFIVFIKNYDTRCYTDESIAKAEALLDELRRVRAISSEQYEIYLGICICKREHNWLTT